MSSYDIGYIIGAFAGAFVVGAAIGAIPLVLGLKKGKKGLAIGGFAACAVSGIILGLLLAIPVCILFVVLILTLKDNNTDAGNSAVVSIDEMPAEFTPSVAENSTTYPDTGIDTSAVSSNSDSGDIFQTLKALHESGTLTDEEYAEQKRKLLGL